MKKQLIKTLIFSSLVLLLISIIFFVGNPEGPILYNQPIKILTKGYIGSSIEIYNYKNKFLIFNGWETILNYNKENRVLGTNQYRKIIELNGTNYTLLNSEDKILLEQRKEITTGFFFKETDFKIIEENSTTKVYWYNEEKDPVKVGYIFTILKNKPIFKVQLFAEVRNNLNLKGAGYGLIINNYNIYLSNGTILKNDYEIKMTDKLKKIILDGEEQDINNPLFKDLPQEVAIELVGTNYKTIPTKSYQIFYNNQNAIIIYADKIDYIDNLFKWQVFRPFISQKENENTFAPLYIAILNDAKLEWKNNTWMIQSKEFNGDVETLIKEWKF